MWFLSQNLPAPVFSQTKYRSHIFNCQAEVMVQPPRYVRFYWLHLVWLSEKTLYNGQKRRYSQMHSQFIFRTGIGPLISALFNHIYPSVHFYITFSQGVRDLTITREEQLDLVVSVRLSILIFPFHNRIK